MNSIINAMTKYDHRQHVLSDWLLELEQRFQLDEVEADRAKITWCQLLIGATSNSILAGLDDGTTWSTAKETLLSRLGTGSMRDEAWVALKYLTKGSKEIIELASEAEKLARRLHPRDEEAAERHAVDAFLSALDRPLAAEVRKLGQNHMEGVVADARNHRKDPPGTTNLRGRECGRNHGPSNSDLAKGSNEGSWQTGHSNPRWPAGCHLGCHIRPRSSCPAASTSLFDASPTASSHCTSVLSQLSAAV